MSPRRIETVIFDIGKVLANFDNMIFCDKLDDFSSLNSLEIHRKIIRSEIVNDFMKGEILAGDFYLQVARLICLDESFGFDNFVEAWNGIFIENKEIEKVLKKLTPDVRLMILSNINSLHWEHLSDEFPVIKDYFLNGSDNRRNLILSFMVGSVKPRKKIFKEATKDIRPGSCLYIDDKIENCDKFRRLGGNSIPYDCNKDPIDFLESELRQYGVLV